MFLGLASQIVAWAGRLEIEIHRSAISFMMNPIMNSGVLPPEPHRSHVPDTQGASSYGRSRHRDAVHILIQAPLPRSEYPPQMSRERRRSVLRLSVNCQKERCAGACRLVTCVLNTVLHGDWLGRFGVNHTSGSQGLFELDH